MRPDDILRDPLLNKGTAFSVEERTRYQLHGRIPCHVSTIEEQAQRRYENFLSHSSELSKHLFLSTLLNRNEILFYRLVASHITEMLPLIYTPTVGEISSQYSSLYTEPRGIYLSYPLRDQIEQILDNIDRDIDVAVVTDGERILGLGDLGTGGMAIPIGKLALYTLFGGIHPAKTLPILLDVGTNNPNLLHDPLYLGWSHPRIRGKEYDDFIACFVTALKKRYPSILLQWEDFGKENAQPILDQYRQQICSFNDDIQGTASVVLAAILSAVRVNNTHLHEQRIVIFGAGSAGMGICHHLVGSMITSGISEEQAKATIYLFDVDGIVHTGQHNLSNRQRTFARSLEEIKRWNSTQLFDLVDQIRPTVLIGVCAQKGVFTQEIVTQMGRYTPHPIIFPLSNPTSKSEAHPADLLKWTQGKAIIATGSPFEPVLLDHKYVEIPQCNNVYIYPGVGLGVIACKAHTISDQMFYKASEVLSRYSPMLHNRQAPLFPPFEQLPEISREIGYEIATVAQLEGQIDPMTDAERKTLVDSTFWRPDYT